MVENHKSIKLNQPFANPNSSEGRSSKCYHPSVGLTPRKLSNILSNAENGHSAEYFSLCSEIEEKWPRYATVMGVRKRQVAQLELDVQPNFNQLSENDTSEKKIRIQHSDLIKRFLDKGTLQNSLFNMLDAIGKGVSITEIIWEHGDLWLPSQLIFRPQQWFEYVDPEFIDNKTISPQFPHPLMMKSEGNSFVPLPSNRFIIHEMRLSNSMCSCSGMGRLAAWWYLFYNHTIKDWLGFMEVYGKPLRLGRYSATASEDEKKKLRSALGALGSDGTAIIPDNMIIEFLQNSQGKSSSDIYHSMTKYIDDKITEAVLGQTLTTEVSQGSFAAANVHDRVRNDIATADKNILTQTIKRDLVKPIIDINFGNQKFYPIINFYHDNSLSKKEKIEVLLKLIPLGLDVGQEQIRKLVGLDEPSKQDILKKIL